MTTKEQNERREHRIQYLVDIPENRVQDARILLRTIGAELDPTGDIAVINDGAPDPGILTGKDIPAVIRAINKQTEEQQDPVPQLPEHDGSWTPRACEKALSLAISFYHWNDHTGIEYEIADPELDEWESVLQEIKRH